VTPLCVNSASGLLVMASGVADWISRAYQVPTKIKHLNQRRVEIPDKSLKTLVDPVGFEPTT
jgi:hypothetical protein